MSKLIKIDNEYKDWIEDISRRFRQSQIKASMKVNDEMLRFYWELGSDISAKSKDSQYGSKFYETISEDLREALPGIKSFSETNLKYMRYFYELYSDAIRPQAGDELPAREKHPQAGDESIRREEPQIYKPEIELGVDAIFYIPWGHNKLIIDKCKGDKEKALFYVMKTLKDNWSRNVLLNFLDTDLYNRQGKAVTNFSLTLPDEQSDLAQEITRDPYNFDFLTLRERYTEKELKDALMNRAENFFMELGAGFAFIGREYRIEIGDTEKYIDLLFYNTKRHCYIVVEVKTGKFESSYAGQLGTYVVAINHKMRIEGDDPTLGILICKDLDKVEAQYALESSSQPLGVSSYELTKLIPEDYKDSMPTIEEIEAELSE